MPTFSLSYVAILFLNLPSILLYLFFFCVYMCSMLSYFYCMPLNMSSERLCGNSLYFFCWHFLLIKQPMLVSFNGLSIIRSSNFVTLLIRLNVKQTYSYHTIAFQARQYTKTIDWFIVTCFLGKLAFVYYFYVWFLFQFLVALRVCRSRRVFLVLPCLWFGSKSRCVSRRGWRRWVMAARIWGGPWRRMGVCCLYLLLYYLCDYSCISFCEVSGQPYAKFLVSISLHTIDIIL